MASRVIKDSIKTSRNVNALSDFQFRLWIHLIISADDYGRGNADPELIKNLAFPRRHGITEKQLSDALAALANKGMVNLYNVDGEPYFYFPKWGDHQRIRQKVSKFPEPSCDNLRQSAAICGELPQDAAECGLNPESRIQNPESRIQNPELQDARSVVIETWNALGVGTIRKVDGSRATHLDARIKENGLDTVVEAVERISKSDFLKGKNDRGWTITFDWFLNPTNFTKVLEGNYDRKPSQTKASGKGLSGEDVKRAMKDLESMLKKGDV